jgi:hypothetical protein
LPLECSSEVEGMGGTRGGSPFDKPASILKSSSPIAVAERAGVGWKSGVANEGFFIVPVLHENVLVDFPEIVVRAPDDLDTFTLKLLTLIYLSNSDGTPPSGTWASYREFPGGRFYEPVVKRSVEYPLASAFGENLDEFEKVAESLEGKTEDFGDAAYSFSLFPHVPICFVIWRSDAEFPSRAVVLFDSNCHHNLSTFDLRIGAQEISSRLIRGLR